VAIYCRVSTDDQSCERQERDLRAFAKRDGHKIVAVFKETASGADNGRPERAKVLALARARRIDAILVTELSRWAATELAPRDTPIAAATMRQMSRSSTKFRNKP
jgi:putative DNA-invertase from lambdoid prophage Rac